VYLAIINGNRSEGKDDRFSQFMFGKKADHKDQVNDLQSLANNIDFERLMKNIDTLMNAYNQLKPGLSKLNPLLFKLIKKA
jgi:cell fate (sporulation/competence/biofilm development) regulator YlbF (YheA/YmcA/DUF963 family)